MKFTDIKFGFYSLITGLASLILYAYNNYNAYTYYLENFAYSADTSIDINADLIGGTTKHPMIFAVVALIFGIFAIINKSKFRVAAVILSGIAFVLSFFPVWVHFI